MIGNMTQHFIYVYDNEAANFLKEHGYILLKKDSKNSIYVFTSKAEINFSEINFDYTLSNTLTF